MRVTVELDPCTRHGMAGREYRASCEACVAANMSAFVVSCPDGKTVRVHKQMHTHSQSQCEVCGLEECQYKPGDQETSCLCGDPTCQGGE